MAGFFYARNPAVVSILIQVRKQVSWNITGTGIAAAKYNLSRYKYLIKIIR